MIPRVYEALRELGVLETKHVTGNPGEEKNKAAHKNHSRTRSKMEGNEGYWDDLCLARFLEGVCWRFVAHPDPDAQLEAGDKMPISTEEAEHRAVSAFQEVFDNGPKIELDHYIVYYAHFEYGRLLARSGHKGGARAQFDMVLCGKPLEVNAAGRKGKYSLENALHVRAHAAVDALEQNRPL